MRNSAKSTTKPLRHEVRASRRKEEKKVSRAARNWSPNRPQPAVRLSFFESLMRDARGRFDNMTRFEQADLVGLSPSTVAKHLDNEVRLPQGRSIQMWLDAMGVEVSLVRKKLN